MFQFGTEQCRKALVEPIVAKLQATHMQASFPIPAIPSDEIEGMRQSVARLQKARGLSLRSLSNEIDIPLGSAHRFLSEGRLKKTDNYLKVERWLEIHLPRREYLSATGTKGLSRREPMRPGAMTDAGRENAVESHGDFSNRRSEQTTDRVGDLRIATRRVRLLRQAGDPYWALEHARSVKQKLGKPRREDKVELEAWIDLLCEEVLPHLGIEQAGVVHRTVRPILTEIEAIAEDSDLVSAEKAMAKVAMFRGDACKVDGSPSSAIDYLGTPGPEVERVLEQDPANQVLRLRSWSQALAARRDRRDFISLVLPRAEKLVDRLQAESRLLISVALLQEGLASSCAVLNFPHEARMFLTDAYKAYGRGRTEEFDRRIELMLDRTKLRLMQMNLWDEDMTLDEVERFAQSLEERSSSAGRILGDVEEILNSIRAGAP